ncbi:sigma-70 family RNA polymerase sigma factor [Niameybacter massiliensis]|uniref:Sigma-70 family RNA polymerase sigma factor n=1 Tax=Holtiella tumoricola TaxID=3018743 RepID=A0AA42DRK2_9FIRM|nr:sigma-70 family RNA polymerase sigma factor [Holtiella tumoricola]MDA3734010.1 sigma-70 family RNA polymerase sigma factor [Holtiella tumoricola]
MEKKRADQIIEYYTRPMYGFALNKMGNSEEAEELASCIILEVYHVLCHKEDFVDMNSYVFKVAHNVWARYISEKTKKKCELQLDEASSSGHEDGPDKSYIDQETEGTLRREIAYLSKQQREIVVSYYYKQKKIKEIAEELELSEGTVKWNLFDAKKELKTGMKAIRTIGNLGINPIKFLDMGHTGQPGTKGDTRDFLAKVITQNIVYAAYHEPRTIRELSEELGISPVFIEDEVKILEEYGFMECLPGGRYQTQMIIREPSASEEEAFHKLAKEYGKILYEEYYKQFLALEPAIKEIGIYYPDQDFNCLLWTLIPYAIQFFDIPEAYQIEPDEVMVYRKDGGKYIAIALLDKPIELSYDQEKYGAMVMTRDDGEDNKVYGWQVGTYWSHRELDWRDNKYSDYVGMMYFVTGQLIESEVTQEIYSRLLEKEYLVRTPEGYKLNVVHVAGKEQMEKLKNLFPKPSDTLRKKLLEYDEKCYKMTKVGHPAHMHKTLRYLAQGRMQHLWPYVFEEMLNQGVLQEPTASQQKAIATLLYTQSEK